MTQRQLIQSDYSIKSGGEIMEYSIRQLSELTGVSARTLRYYDQIGLLHPKRTSEAGYRYYGSKEVDLLQQILFYKESGLELSKISEIIYNQDFDKLLAMKEHLLRLEDQQKKISRMIDTVKQTIASMKGEIYMNDYEKFEVFKKNMVEKNDQKYGIEIREKYSDKIIKESNQKFLNMTKEECRQFQILENEIRHCLEKAVKNKKLPSSEAAENIAELHKQWLQIAWDSYSSKAHRGMAQLYVMDERFTKYYDENVEGCARFLKEAIEFWIQEDSENQ